MLAPADGREPNDGGVCPAGADLTATPRRRLWAWVLRRRIPAASDWMRALRRRPWMQHPRAAAPGRTA